MTTMNFKLTRVAALAATYALSSIMSAQAGVYDFSFSGGGFTASGTFTLAPSGYAGTESFTDITGTFTDTNAGISGAITGLETATVTPDPFAGTFVPGYSSQGFSFDDYFYPAGNSPVVCVDYPFAGGVLDCYGLVFDIAGGYSADLWSNGVVPPGTAPQYNVADADANGFLTYPNPEYGVGTVVDFGFQPVPEPSSFAFLGAGMLGLVAFKRRKKAG